MIAVTRVGDIAVGVCYGHLFPIGVMGIVASGEGTVTTDNRPTSTIGSVVVFNCGHAGIIVSGTKRSLCKNKPLGQIGSLVVGTMVARVVMGSSVVYSE